MQLRSKDVEKKVMQYFLNFFRDSTALQCLKPHLFNLNLCRGLKMF